MRKSNIRGVSHREMSRTHSLLHRTIQSQEVAKGRGSIFMPGDKQEAGRSVDAREHLKGRLALPVPEVAELLGISSATVRLMIVRGNLPGRKVGGGTERITYIVPTGALLVWLDGTAGVVPEEGAA